jgi:hypothetical protein
MIGSQRNISSWRQLVAMIALLLCILAGKATATLRRHGRGLMTREEEKQTTRNLPEVMEKIHKRGGKGKGWKKKCKGKGKGGSSSSSKSSKGHCEKEHAYEIYAEDHPAASPAYWPSMYSPSYYAYANQHPADSPAHWPSMYSPSYYASPAHSPSYYDSADAYPVESPHSPVAPHGYDEAYRAPVVNDVEEPKRPSEDSG